jgi:carbon-monoxide dehydrogenase small subunit
MNEEKDCSMFAAHPASSQEPVTLHLTVNGEEVCYAIDPTMSLLHFLRDKMKLFGTKEACGEGECGACTVIMNGKAVTSCLVLAVEAEGANVLTVEGLASKNKLSILQEEFIKHDALQCGFCTPGILMSARALLDENPSPSDDEIKEALAGNLCRCTGYVPILDAVRAAAQRERSEL